MRLQLGQTATGDERREMLRLVVDELRVYPDYAELKLMLLDPIRLDLSRSRRPAAV